MTDVLLMTAVQAEQVRGPSSADASAVLDPVEMTDGRLYLNAVVLDDPAHADMREVLAALPRVPFPEIAPYLNLGDD